MTDSTSVADTTAYYGTKSIYAYPLDDYILVVAAAVGILIVIIGYFFAGGKYNQTKLLFSIVVASGVGILILPGLFKLAAMVGVRGPIVNTAIVLFDMIFVAIVASHAYEIVTVTAQEAHPD
jgi:hypothetical protein